MNLPPNPRLSRTDRSIGSVLSAVGSLLMALGGERAAHEQPQAEAIEEFAGPMMLPPSAIPPTRVRAEMSSVPPLTSVPPRDLGFGSTDAPASTDTTDEVTALLADARARAQAIMDESMARAEELLRPPASDTEAIERIRRTVSDIAVDVRAIHARLDEIEALVRGGQSGGRASFATPREAPTVIGSQPAAAPTPAAEADASATPAAPAPPPQSAAPTSMPAAAIAPPPAPAPPTAIPPMPSVTPPPASAPAAAAREEAAPAPEVPAVDAYDPMAGAVSLRISPVAGFQGLMRVQDALVRIRGVREAGVEAYAQGEARLRLRLSASLEPGAIALALADLLARPTRVVAASTAERTLQLELE